VEEPTPEVNGYKLIRQRNNDNPFWDRLEKEPVGFKVPQTPAREELSHQLANTAQAKKRKEKEREKAELK